MNILRIAAFSEGNQGGNPAGVVILDTLPGEQIMQKTAAEVGFSETVFTAKTGDGWRTRYFAPSFEVPFCGHATIALGAALALQEGDGIFPLILNQSRITVEGHHQNGKISAALQSPPTWHKAATKEMTEDALNLFGLTYADLNPDIPPAFIHGGADHFCLSLQSRDALKTMHYDFEKGRALMRKHGWVTILLNYAETKQLFHTRNPFAAGGVYEDAATGAATAAFAGYLRDLNWPHGGVIEIIQGEDMGMLSRLRAEISPEKGSSIRISGAAHIME
ncbi:PhzF family phenazine biosynthesis protein [Paenochrobactrum glaciei]|uniref:PhzF family phenazine biosynthesis protein n=1 Tax=Paenochrobactrum glaciei TaxID=486407 RepID=A0ABP3RA11_9HYPH